MFENHTGNNTSLVLVLGYSISSISLALLNKYALVEFPHATFILALQLLTSSIISYGIGAVGLVAVDSLQWNKIYPFIPATLLFYAGLVVNLILLEHVNVDTFVVFRSVVPIMVQISDCLFRGSPWPSWSNGLILLFLAAVAMVYMLLDNETTMVGYTWALVDVLIITISNIYIKTIVTEVELQPWGLVYYSNSLSLVLVPFGLWLSPVTTQDLRLVCEPYLALALGMACVSGCTISFFGLNLRKALSATNFAIIGLTSKIMLVIVNAAIWSRHATPSGLAIVLVCILTAACHQLWYSVRTEDATTSPETKYDQLPTSCPHQTLSLS